MKRLLFLPPFVCALFLLQSKLSAQQNVGVGTTTPGYRLDVQGDPTTPGTINLYSKVNYVGANMVTAIEGYSKPGDGVGYGGRFTGGYRGLESYNLGGTYSGSSIGIYGFSSGTTGNRFGIYGEATGGSNNYSVYGFATGGAGYYAVYGSCTNLSGYAGYFNGRGLFTHELRTNDNLYVDDNVGIGTITPSAKLQILGGTDASLTTNGFAQFGPTTGWNLVFDDNEIIARNNGAGGDLLFQQDAGNILMCGNEQGKVAIGITTAANLPTGYLFSVDGKIIAEEMRIQNSDNWPDYVFNDSYHRMSLDELQKSIRIHKHLPNIPSADDVEKNGLLVGDMEKHMMEKIEELTLYILDMHEVNKTQQAEIDRMKAEIAALKNP